MQYPPIHLTPNPLSVTTARGRQTTPHPPQIETESSPAPLSVITERGKPAHTNCGYRCIISVVEVGCVCKVFGRLTPFPNPSPTQAGRGA